MQTVIAKIGPVISSINVDLLFDYTGGIISSPNCSHKLNHNILIVGYNKTGQYYIVKNRFTFML
jgi:hypothetical protein